MKYESTILKRLIDTYGVVGNPRYISEIIKEFIVQGKERFPELFTYQSDWLAHIDEFGLNPTYTVGYTGQSIYAPNTLESPVKSAILSGNTLVNLNNYNIGYKGFSEVDGTEISFTNNGTNLPFINLMTPYTLKSSTRYTVIFDVIDNPLGFGVVFYHQKNATLGSVVKPIAKNQIGLFKFTLDTNEKESDCLRIALSATEVVDNTKIKNIVILEGDYTNINISYFEGMQSVKMPVLTTTGKNVFDLANSGLREESAYDKSLHSSGFWSFGIQLEPNKDVTISRKNSEGYNLGLNLKIHNENTSSGGKWLIANHAQSENKSSATLTTNSDGYIWFIFSNNFDKINQILDMCEYIQIEYGTVATSYEPFKSNILTVNEDVMLRGIGDVQDTLDLMTGEMTERIGEVVLDGSENWVQYNGYGVDGYSAFITTMPSLNNLYVGNVMCFISCDFPTGTWSEYMGGTINELVWNHDPNKIGIRVKSEKASNVEEIKEFLSTNNIRINYKLATESIKTVDLTILDQNGQNVKQLMSFNGGTHFNTRSSEGSPLPSVSVSVETDLEEVLLVCSLEGNTI